MTRFLVWFLAVATVAAGFLAGVCVGLSVAPTSGDPSTWSVLYPSVPMPAMVAPPLDPSC